MNTSIGHHLSVVSSPPPRALTPHRLPVTSGPGARPQGSATVIGIRLLGRFAVEHDGQEIPLGTFGGRLARRLLRLLALRRGTLVPKDLIADVLWPEDPPANPAGNIEVLVSRIRRAVGDRALIQAGAGGYVLAGGGSCWIDAEEFLTAVQAGQVKLATQPAEALVSFRAALGIWRGEPLPEDTYAGWAQADQRHLTLTYLDALDGAAAAALEGVGTAGATEAASWARQAVAAEPLRESSVLLLVRALAVAGNQAGALAAFDEYRDRLAAETGLDPTPQARTVRQRILAGQFAPGQPARYQARPASPDRPSPDRGDPFLGRERERAVISAAAAGRGPRVVLVTGPSGIGKSALLAEAARRADIPVLAAQAFAPDHDEAWSLAGGLLGQAARWLPVPVATVLAEPEASALATVVPGLAGPPGVALGGADEETRRAFALQGAVRLIAATARPRCLIVADDLQWADPTSLTLLGLLLRRVDGVSLAAAYRTDAQPGTDPVAALGLPAPQLASLTLEPLPARVIRRLFGDELLAEAIIRQAGRTPFTVTEVITSLARQRTITRHRDGRWRLRPGCDAAEGASIVAAAIRQAAGNRLAGLPARWRDMLSLLALLGRPAPPALLAAANNADLRSALDTLEGLGSARLASLCRQGWTLGHDLLRQAVSASIGPAETARYHALLAQALRQCDADPTEVARHLAASGDNDEAARAYAAAARRQLDLVRDREAMRLAGTGLSLGPGGRTRAELLVARGEARRRAGQLTAARADFTAALDSIDDAAFRSQVLTLLAILDARTADVARGSELVELAIAEASGQPAALGQALAAAAIIDLTGGNLARARCQVRRAGRLLDQAGDSRGSARLLYWRAMACFIEGRLGDAASQLDRLAHLAVTPGEVLRLWSPRATRGHALVFLGRAADGLTEIEETLAWARAARHPAVEAECQWRRAEALAALGRATEALGAAERAAAIATRIRHAEWTAAAHRGLGIAYESAGLPGRAESAYLRSLEAAEGIPFFRAWAAARLGALLARQGRPDEAGPHVQAALAGGTPLTHHEARWAHAELLASRGDGEAGSASAATALDRARDDGYLILVPRLRELAAAEARGRKAAGKLQAGAATVTAQPGSAGRKDAREHGGDTPRSPEGQGDSCDRAHRTAPDRA